MCSPRRAWPPGGTRPGSGSLDYQAAALVVPEGEFWRPPLACNLEKRHRSTSDDICDLRRLSGIAAFRDDLDTQGAADS